jgi:NAD(P)-dependent dehydrogenase (short-subunit alcohol dehydrogenase family)
MSRFADPMEVANVVLWLVSDEVSHMSGQNITISLS